MSTVNDAIEAGARAMSHHWRDMHTNESLGRQRQLAVHATRAMWPVLSAGLRELHRPVWACGNPRHTNPDVGCPECDEVCRTCTDPMPCPSARELDRVDWELGIETGNQSGAAQVRPVWRCGQGAGVVIDPNSGVGWYEVIHPSKATTHIAYIHGDGSIYFPEGEQVLDAHEFEFAAARGNAHRLVRADSQSGDPAWQPRSPQQSTERE